VEERIVTSPKGPIRYNAVAAAVLFAASAGVAVWQASRLTVLWDVSYVLENAARIAVGDVPYRDFPFPYAPLTFVVQAAIIRAFGRVYWHHVAYAALACGLASALAYAIVRRLLPAVNAALICVPLCVVGIYCILPNPFYDPDCCLAILIIVLILVILDRDSIAQGALCVLPLFIKQNIGLFFLAAVAVAFLILRRWRSLAGVAIAVAAALALLAATTGIANYYRWTIEYAAARRLPPLADQLAIYNDPDLWWWLVLGIASLALRRTSWLIAVPFAWSEYRFFFSDDPNEAEINFLRAWPFFMILALIVGCAAWRRERGVIRLLPFLLVPTIHGAFLSQGTWGSTYGIWPLLVLLMAIVIRCCATSRVAVAVIAATLLHVGAWYIVTNKRLAYAKWNEGEMHVSTLAPLSGLHVRGPWLPQFEQLVQFAEREIPRDDAVLCLPGEDLFYFTTGRRPRVPVLMFDATVNPLSPREIVSMTEGRHVHWIVVKRRLQINGVPFPELEQTLRLLGGRLTPAARLDNYDIYRLPPP
jgi:hypothetical protein